MSDLPRTGRECSKEAMGWRATRPKQGSDKSPCSLGRDDEHDHVKDGAG